MPLYAFCFYIILVSLARKQAEYDILLELLFGKATDFYTRLYENGDINTSFSFGYEAHTNFGFCEISGTSNHPDRVYQEILAEIARVRETGLNAEDFERVKRVFYATSIRSFNSTEEIANEFIADIFRGYDMLEYPDIISSVTMEDIRRRFESDFLEERCVLSKILPLD